MAGGGREILEGAEDLDMAGNDYGTGGRHPKGPGDIFQGSSAGGSFIWVRDVGEDPLYGTGPGKIPAQCKQADNREAAKENE